MTYRLAPRVNTRTALVKLAPIFSRYNPSIPFQYHFVDESYATKFDFESLIGKLAGQFASLAILISCIGLFGLAAYGGKKDELNQSETSCQANNLIFHNDEK